MYYESFFSLRQDSTKISNIPIASYVYLENKCYVNEFHPFRIRLVLRFFRFFYLFFFKKHLDKIGCGTRQKYGYVLFKHSCAIHPVDSGTEFFDDSLGDKLRFAYGYRTHKPSAILITLLECISLGAFWILLHWFPLIKFLLSHYPCRLLQATHVVLVTQKGEEHVINVFRPFISPCEAVNFDNWPALCTFCGMKQKLCKESPSENWKSINDNLLKKPDLLKEYIDNQKTMQENNKAFTGDLSEIYRDEWCSCGNKNRCNKAESTHTHLYMFRFRLLRYYLNLRENCFYLICFNTKLNPIALHSHLGKGISSQALYESRERIYGSDTIKPYPLIRTIIEELTEPFYVFQILSVALWIWDDYLEYAYIVIAQMLISSIYDISVAREYERRILQLALDLNFDVNVFRSWMHKDDSFLQEIKWSSDLYENEQLLSKWLNVVTAASLQPGELFEIVKGMTLPCDTILLSGNVICSETFLSGESTPQTKTCLPGSYRQPNCRKQRTTKRNLKNLDSNQQTENSVTLMKEYNIDEDTQHTLYAGTHVIELQPLKKSQRVLGLCIRTRFLSSHGRLIRSSLFPTGPFFDFSAQALSFFGYMFLFSLIGAGISIATGCYFHFSVQVIVIRTLDLFTDALPPALPAVLGMGIVVAMNHLSSHYKINCINAGRINLAGLIDTFVFDKTGTLTEQKLSFYGCIQVESSQCHLYSPKMSIQQKFYTNVLSRPSKYTPTHSCARKRETQKIKRKLSISKKQLLTGPTELRHFHSVLKPLHHFVKPKSAFFGFLQIQPTLLKRHFLEAMATCHSLSLIDNTVRGDPLDSTLLHFTDWKIHNIQDDIAQVEQFMLCLRRSIGNDKRLLNHFKTFLQFSPQELVIRQIFDLYKTNHTLPTIIKPPQEPISFLQNIRRTRFSHIITALSEIQTDSSSTYASLMAINVKTFLISLTKLSDTVNKKKISKNQWNELAILRRFAFTPSLKRVTVIVRNPITQNIYVYTKGSPETMVSLCKTTSLPASFYSLVAYYTRTGHRIVIVCGRSLGKLSGSLVDSLTRKQVERKLILLGFVLFSNRLKLDTCETIQKLNQGHCRCILTTGDNPLTALSVAEKSGIIENNKKHTKKIILGDLYVPAKPSTEEVTKTCFIWTKISNCFEANTYKTRKHPKVLKRKRHVKKKEVNLHIEIEKLLQKKWNKRVTLDLKDFLCGKNPRDFEFILTGRAYRKLRMIHESLQLQWFDEVTNKRSIPHSLPFTSYGFNNTFSLFNDWKHFSISKKKNTLISLFKHPRNFSQQIFNHVPNFSFLNNSFVRDTSEYAEFNDSSLKMSSLKASLLDSSLTYNSYNGKTNLVADSKVLPLVQQRTTEILSHTMPFTNSSSRYIGKFLLKEYPFDILSQPSMACVVEDSLAKRKTIHESCDRKQHNNSGQNTKNAISVKFKSLTVYSPCTIFNRLGFLHPYKTGSLKKFDRQHFFSFSSLIHASILATGNHPKMLSNRIIFQDSQKKIEQSFNNHLLVFGSQFQESFENLKQCESRKLNCVHAFNSTHPIHNSVLCSALKSNHRLSFDSLKPYSFPYPFVYIFHTKLKKIRAFRVLHKISSHSFTALYQEYLKKKKLRSTKGGCFRSNQRKPYHLLNIIRKMFYNVTKKSSLFLHTIKNKIIHTCTFFWLCIPFQHTKFSECRNKIVPHITGYTTLSKSCNSATYLDMKYQAGNQVVGNRSILAKWLFGERKNKFDTSIQNESLTTCLLPKHCVSSLNHFNINGTETTYESCNSLLLSSPNKTQSSTVKSYRLPLSKIKQSDNYSYFMPQTHTSQIDISNSHLSQTLLSDNSFLKTNGSFANNNFPKKDECSRCYNRSTNIFTEEDSMLKIYDAPLRVNHSAAEFQTHFPSEFLEKNLLEHIYNMDAMSLSVAVFQNTHTFKNKENNNSFNLKQISSITMRNEKKENNHNHVHVSINDSQNEDCYPQLIRIWLFEYLLRQTRVYAGMLPEDKTSLVSTLRSLPYTFAVGMCGDGANNSRALRAADVGISLNNEEVSVVAPFLSQNASISCCTAVLCEGRTSLENAIEMFSFIVFYSLIQYTSVVMLYLYGLNFSDNQYLFVDFLVILPLSTILSKKHHSTQFKGTVPNVNLFSKYFVLHIVLHTAVGTLCMILLLISLRFTPGWVPCYITPLAGSYKYLANHVNKPISGDSDGAEVASYENTAIFYFTNFLYPLLTIFSVYENRWKEEKFKNWLFGLCYTLLIGTFFIVIVYPRPGTILIPTLKNVSPKPLPTPPITSISYLSRLLIIVDQTLVLVKLPYQANVLIFTLLLLCISISALVQILVLNPIKKQEEFYSNYCRQYNNEFIPSNTKRNKLEVYQCF